MSRHLVFYIIAGIGSLLLMMIREQKYPEIQTWKMTVMAIWLTITSVFSIKLLYFVEYGNFSGDAWFGAVLLMPVFMMPMVLLKSPYKKVLNLYTPTLSLAFAIVKIDCCSTGCCMGKYLPTLGFQFPSQFVDIGIGIAVTAVLMWMEYKKPNVLLYPWLMVIFGAARFAVDWFRYVPKPWKWILPSTIIWSLLAIAIGMIWLIVLRKIENNTPPQHIAE